MIAIDAHSLRDGSGEYRKMVGSVGSRTKKSIYTNPPVRGARGAISGSHKIKPAAAPKLKRLHHAKGKRHFRLFSAKNPFKAKANEAYRIDHSPFQLSMRSVKLRVSERSFGMDDSRKQNQRNILWYWQWSRDWDLDASAVKLESVSKTADLALIEHTSTEARKRSMPPGKTKSNALKALVTENAASNVLLSFYRGIRNHCKPIKARLK